MGDQLFDFFSRLRGPRSRAIEIAREDDAAAAHLVGRRFSLGQRPVIRWVIVDGFIEGMRAAIGQATRLFGNEVDYCLCTRQINSGQVRDVLASATQPVEWWPLSPSDNLTLAEWLDTKGIVHQNCGPWWKWFPERARMDGPEWLVHGTILFKRPPPWYSRWAAGADTCRILEHDCDQRWSQFDAEFVSLPPQQRFMPAFETAFSTFRKKREEPGERQLSRKAFHDIGAEPISTCEIPNAAFAEHPVGSGSRPDLDHAGVWALNFGHKLRRGHPDLEELLKEGSVWWPSGPETIIERFAWMGNFGQWGVPGWSMPEGCAAIIVEHARGFAGRRVLELGTSRGRLTAMLATVGCLVTTIDRHDRGAAKNLAGLDVSVIVQDAKHFLATTSEKFDLIVVDVHGNSEAEWKIYSPLLFRCLENQGTLIIDNATLWQIPEWGEETGVRWFLDNLAAGWVYRLYPEPLPGVAIVKKAA